MNGNWAQLDMTGTHGASTQQAALALTLFWAMVTAGRIFFAAMHRIRPEWTYHLLPFILAAVFLLIAALPTGSTWGAVGAFGVGPVLDTGTTLPQVYRWAALVALAMGALSFAVRRRDSAVRPP